MIYHAGHELGFMTTQYTTAPVSTTAGDFTASFSRCAIQSHYQAASIASFAEVGGGSSGVAWLHFVMKISSASASSKNTGSWIIGKNAGGDQTFKLVHSATTSYAFDVRGQGATTLGDTTAFTVTELAAFDISIIAVGSDTQITVYRNSTQIGQFTEEGVAPRALASVEFYGTTTNTSYLTKISAVIVADEATLGWQVITVPPTGAGNYTGWSGAYTDVDEISPDTAYAESDAAEEKVTYTNGGVAALLGDNRIKGVAMGGLVSADVGLKRIVRNGTTDSIAALTGVASSLAPHVVVLNSNPVADAPWGQADLSAFEFGYESM